MSKFYLNDRNCDILNKNKDEVIEELKKLPRELFVPFPVMARFLGIEENSVEYKKEDWLIFPLMFMGETIDKLRNIVPTTIKTLEEIGTMNSYISLMHAEDEIEEHMDGGYDNNITKRYHLCVTAEEGKSYLQSEEEKIYYKEGLVFGFDNAKNHQAKNESKNERVVLLLDGVIDGNLNHIQNPYTKEEMEMIKQSIETNFMV